MGFFSALVIFLHNIPEGLATYVSVIADPYSGAAVAFAIALHNIPEASRTPGPRASSAHGLPCPARALRTAGRKSRDSRDSFQPACPSPSPKEPLKREFPGSPPANSRPCERLGRAQSSRSRPPPSAAAADARRLAGGRRPPHAR